MAKVATTAKCCEFLRLLRQLVRCFGPYEGILRHARTHTDTFSIYHIEKEYTGMFAWKHATNELSRVQRSFLCLRNRQRKCAKRNHDEILEDLEAQTEIDLN